MPEHSGDFDIHLTVSARRDVSLDALADRYGLKLTHIVLDRGRLPSQPMLSRTGSGTLAEQISAAEALRTAMRADGVSVNRIKIEAAPWNPGVPETPEAVIAEPRGRYFEHHVKLLLPDAELDRILALTDLVVPHGARPSRNARRKRSDGRDERFVTQRCFGVPLPEATSRLDALLSALRDAGHEILEFEQEYVVHDDHLWLDDGWIDPPRSATAVGENQTGIVPAGRQGYPSTYQPVYGDDVAQRAAFDPALKQFMNAFRAGEPVFADADAGRRWLAARRAAMTHVLSIIVASEWANSLVLRGSVTMRSWFGDAAREPGDLDFVVLPFSRHIHAPESAAMLDGIVAAVRANPAGLRPDEVKVEDIWTYERADGRRLVFPFTGDPDGAVQLDFVFNEFLPIPPEPITVPGISDTMLAATPALSLAWKLLWLETDMYPQGKDLYDAVLLAEHTTISRSIVVDLLRPELGAEADGFGHESVLAWDVDWENFRTEYPTITGEGEQWKRRLARTLETMWRP
ncbi:nucleotidyl transferase AbiEii/AbiGii toxin family protein [Herbihabitans rhizosphaerae]|nr:nucleotidyl transferase AbiEii/AbiGii toxin family protein [Herbihabitans rhizosphaerae]